MIATGMLLLLAWAQTDPGPTGLVVGVDSLVDLDNRRIVEPAKKPTKAICLIFLGAECPVSNALIPEISRIQTEYGPRGVVFAGVYPDPDVDADRARAHGREYMAGLRQIPDPKLAVARQAKIELTPEATILDKAGKVLWRGRVNDLWTPAGKKRLSPQNHDLRLALDAVLENRPPPPAKGKGYGCPLPEMGRAGEKDH